MKPDTKSSCTSVSRTSSLSLQVLTYRGPTWGRAMPRGGTFRGGGTFGEKKE